MRAIHLNFVPGDGIGPEVLQEGKRVLKRVAEVHGGLRFEFQQFDWGCQYYLKHGKMMPDEGLQSMNLIGP